VHVPREQNARADLLAKLASSGKGGRQRKVIQETLKAPRTFVVDNMVGIHQVGTVRGRARSHKSVTQETLRTPSVSAYPVVEGEPMQICIVEEGDTWMTPYRRCTALVVGSNDVAPSYSIGVLTRRQVWQKGRRSGGS